MRASFLFECLHQKLTLIAQPSSQLLKGRRGREARAGAGKDRRGTMTGSKRRRGQREGGRAWPRRRGGEAGPRGRGQATAGQGQDPFPLPKLPRRWLAKTGGGGDDARTGRDEDEDEGGHGDEEEDDGRGRTGAMEGNGDRSRPGRHVFARWRCY